MKLHLANRAVNPDRVRYFLMEKGVLEQVPCTEVSIMKSEHRTADYRRLSPLAQVPVLELDDGRTLTESRAICTYFEGLFPEPNLMGETTEERAFIEMWDRRIELLYMMAIANWFRHTHPAALAIEPNQVPAWGELNSGRAESLAVFFDRRLADSAFVAGERFTIADITLFATLGFGRIVKHQPWTQHASLSAWRDRMLARPAFA
jgi:glutathione S-transferase